MGNDSISIFDKVKLLVWLNGLTNKGGSMLQKLDGLKSVIGLLMVVAYYAVPSFGGPHLPDVLLKIGMSFAGIGLAAKLEKGTGLLSKGLDYAHKALDVLQAVVKAIAPQPEQPKA